MTKSLKTKLKQLFKNADPAIASKIMADCEALIKGNQNMINENPHIQPISEETLLNHALRDLATYRIKPSDHPELFAAYTAAVHDQFGTELKIHADTGYLAAQIDRLDWQIFVTAVNILYKTHLQAV